ncbi:hypothetical protein F5Y05DRAFT_371567 [Hypoxylon sp. FL0543]|nr:hypothetical protein F5Y05DRAFT_371567 [Hypoxylon sp. FL0543]
MLSGAYSSGIDDGGNLRYSPMNDFRGYPGADDANPMLSLPNSPGLGSANVLGPLSPPETVATPKADSNPPAKTRSMTKPQRPVTQNKEGLYYCDYPGCDEETKKWKRKSEWTKHMDKHDRPYKCQKRECEKVAGFTYPGGLMRHEREVHHMHGGPQILFCPHANCIRNHGTGFTRMENLNEHLRRVHVHRGDAGALARTPEEEGEGEEVAPPAPSGKAGKKRKADDDLREENKRLRSENEGLKAGRTECESQIIAQNRQINVMSQQIAQLQAEVRALRTSAAPNVLPAA